VVIGTVFSPSYLAHQRAERIQSVSLGIQPFIICNARVNKSINHLMNSTILKQLQLLLA
jgi:hypothetical protein